MNCLVWNFRGFNHPLKQKEVVDRIKKLKINFVCLLETWVKQNNMHNIVKRMFPCWNIIHNYSEAYNGRIWYYGLEFGRYRRLLYQIRVYPVMLSFMHINFTLLLYMVIILVWLGGDCGFI